MLHHCGFWSGAKPNPDFVRSVIALWSIEFFNCSYLISKARILYLFAGKFLLLISVKISSLVPFRNYFSIELKTSLFVDFVSTVFSKHSAITKTHKEQVKFTQFFTMLFFLFISYFDLHFLHMPFLDIIPRSSHRSCSLKKALQIPQKATSVGVSF